MIRGQDIQDTVCHVEVTDGETVIQKNEYDGLNRRTEKHFSSQAPKDSYGIDTYRHFFYNASWQILETRKGDDEDTEPETIGHMEYQYVWSARYIDSPVLREEYIEEEESPYFGQFERLYYTTDANMNVTAVTDANGEPLARYFYDAYGKVTVIDLACGLDYGNAILFAGYHYDFETGLYHVRNRSYHPLLGRWLQRDPLEYVDGMGLYEYVRSNPMRSLDPQGRDTLQEAIEDGKLQADEIHSLRFSDTEVDMIIGSLNGVKKATKEEVLQSYRKKADELYWAIAPEYRYDAYVDYLNQQRCRWILFFRTPVIQQNVVGLYQL